MTKHKTRNWYKQAAHAALYGSDEKIGALPQPIMRVGDEVVHKMSKSELEQLMKRLKEEGVV